MTTELGISLKERGYRALLSTCALILTSSINHSVSEKKRKMVSERMIFYRIFPLILIIASLVLLQSCTDSLDRSPFEPEYIGNDIDDTLLLDSGLEILGGTVKSTSISIGFRFKKDNSEDHEVWIERGISGGSFDFKEILNKHPNNYVGGLKNVYHFENLKSKTTYVIQFTRIIGADTRKLSTEVTTK